MVFSHAFDSVISTLDDNMPQQGQIMKRSETQLSLKDLISPFGPNKRSSPIIQDIYKQSTLQNVESRNGDTRTTAASAITPHIVIVGPEHSRVRRRSRPTIESFHVPQTDVTQHACLPISSVKLNPAEYSAAEHHRRHETPLANESRGDSTAEIPSVPFSHETRLVSRNQDTPRAINPKTRATGTNNNHTLTMSSPNNHKLQSRRSRSIAIKTPQHASYASQSEISASEEDSASNERMYDWATWRMYNRIVDHRRNQPLPSPSQRLSDPPINSFAMNASEPSSEYFHDGEVFELEI